jgi:hypothetical protein
MHPSKILCRDSVFAATLSLAAVAGVTFHGDSDTSKRMGWVAWVLGDCDSRRTAQPFKQCPTALLAVAKWMSVVDQPVWSLNAP